jgi:hypothetical protein
MKSADDLQKILQEVCFEHSLEVRGTVEKYFSPFYRQLTDGHSSDREAFIQHISAVRQHIAVGRIRVDAFLISGNHFADRHHVSATKTDGSQVEIEIYLFGEIDPQGKILAAHELTRVIRGGTADEQLGRIQE